MSATDSTASSDRVDRFLAEALQTDGPVEISLDDLKSADRRTSALVSTALLGTLGARELHLTIPDGATPPPWIERAGLAFAIANRHGETRIGAADGASQFSAWRRTWTPGSRDAWLSLFEPADASGELRLFGPRELGESEWQPDLFGPGFAAFVNPHRTGATRGAHPLQRVLRPWLDRLVPGTQPRETRQPLLDDLGALTDELLANICEHGARRGPEVHSIVHVGVARGETDRIHLVFADTGEGILTTLRPKLRRSDEKRGDHEILRGALVGELRGWGPGRGMGLPEVLRVCRRHRAHLVVHTSAWKVESQAGGEPIVARRAFDLRGTVAVATFQLSA